MMNGIAPIVSAPIVLTPLDHPGLIDGPGLHRSSSFGPKERRPFGLARGPA